MRTKLPFNLPTARSASCPSLGNQVELEELKVVEFGWHITIAVENGVALK